MACTLEQSVMVFLLAATLVISLSYTDHNHEPDLEEVETIFVCPEPAGSTYVGLAACRRQIRELL
jgi:hypothetical protein